MGVFLKWWYPPKNTPKWSFLVGKPMVVGYHHFRKPPYTHNCTKDYKGIFCYLKRHQTITNLVLINLRNDHHFSLGGISVAFHVYGEVVSRSGVTPSCTRRKLTVPMISIPPITYPNLIQMFLCFLLLLLLLWWCFHLLPPPPTFWAPCPTRAQSLRTGLTPLEHRSCANSLLPPKGDLPGTPKDEPPPIVSRTHTIPISLGIRTWEWYGNSMGNLP